MTLVEFESPLIHTDGLVLHARACGEERADTKWVGWIEFDSDDGHHWRTARETTQPNRVDLEYWATGLTPVFLEGAFVRAVAD